MHDGLTTHPSDLNPALVDSLRQTGITDFSGLLPAFGTIVIFSFLDCSDVEALIGDYYLFS